jgi:glyoxylase-like metal-dependent hydrolase (beta-lactamase superfamily II)
MSLEPPVRVGNVTITPIVESALWSSPDAWIKGQDHSAVIAATREWCDVTVADDGWVVVPVRSYVVASEGQTIVVDTGQGESSPFAGMIPGWRVDGGDYLADLAAAGVDPASVDLVVMTHAHPDHVGWNTREVDGELVPTFPNARYLLCERDWTMVEGFAQLAERPLLSLRRLGVLDLAPGDRELTSEVRLLPTHGHTPGHVCVEIESAGERALILGDVVHHKLSLAHPELPEASDNDEALATRRALYARYAGSDVLILASHFEGPAAGYLKRRGEGYEFAATR